MKHYLRYLSLLLLATWANINASATDWTLPIPAFTPLSTGDTVYVYNVGADRFYNRGEWWGTQAILSNTGMRFVIRTAQEQRSLMGSEPEEGEIPDGIYTIYSDDTGNGNHLTGRFDDGYIYVDSYFTNGKPSRTYWSILPVDGQANVYQILTPSYLTEDNPYAEANYTYVEGQALGYNPDLTATTWCLRWNLAISDYPSACQWAFVSPAEYAIRAAKTELKSIADDAESKGIDLSAAKAVFDNPSATIEEINAAINALKEAISNAASPDNPTNLAGSYLINPTFDEGSGSERGWSLDSNCQNKGNKTAANNDSEALWIGDPADGAFSYPFWENWRNGNLETKMYQTMNGLPNGVYKVSLSAFVQTFAPDNETNFNQYVYFNDQKFALTQGPFKAYSTMMNIEDGKLEMGFVQTGFNNSWVGIDNAELIYYGASLDSYKYMTQALTENMGEEFDGKLFNQTYYDAVIALNEEANAASSKEEALEVYAKTMQALQALRDNMTAYETLKTRNEYFLDAVWQSEYDGDDDLVELTQEIEALLQDPTMTTEEVLAKLEQLEATARAARENKLTPDSDVSEFITNSSFTNAQGNADFNGWTVTKSDNGFANNAGNTGVIEQWHGSSETGSLDISQSVKLPKGAYRLETRAYYRCANDPQNAYNAWVAANGENSGANEVHVSIFAGTASALFNNLMKRVYTEDEKNEMGVGAWGTITASDGGTVYSPDNCTAANAMFNYSDDWNVSLEFMSDGNPVTLGVKGDNIGGWAWPLWDDFKLTYLGKDYETLQPIFSNIINDAEALLEKPMSAQIKAALQEAIDNGKGAEDGNAILKAYEALKGVMETANASIDTYQMLVDANNELISTIDAYGSQTKAETLAAAQALYAEVEDGINNGAYTDEEVADKVAEVNVMIALVRIPEGTNGSVENPVNFTSVIINPTYTKGLKGWTETPEFAGKVSVEQETTTLGTQIGFAEGWNTAFDIYQDITGLPQGTFRVRVQGLYRQEGIDTDRKTWKYGYAESIAKLDLLTDDEKNNVVPFDPRAKIYANGDTIDFVRWIFIPDNEEDAFTLQSGLNDEGGWATFEDNITDPDVPVTYYYPNNRQALANRCDFGMYTNELICYVDASGTLRIGACNKTGKANDWVPFSNWQLEYLGDDQSINNIGNAASQQIMTQAVYTIDGRQVNGLQKGVNIIRTMTADGIIKVKKVIVR